MRSLIWPRRTAMLSSSAGKLFFAGGCAGAAVSCRDDGLPGRRCGPGFPVGGMALVACIQDAWFAVARAAGFISIGIGVDDRGSRNSSARCPSRASRSGGSGRGTTSGRWRARRRGCAARRSGCCCPPGEAACRRLGRPALGDLSLAEPDSASGRSLALPGSLASTDEAAAKGRRRRERRTSAANRSLLSQRAATQPVLAQMSTH